MAIRLCLLICCALAACGEVKSTDRDGGTPDASGPDAAPDDRPNGQACTDNVQCLNGNCVDGVCCNSACAGQCEACDAEGSIGTCAAVTGAPHGAREACAGADTVCAGSCDGNERTACVYPTTECRGATCTGTTKTAAASCSMGACPEPQTETCGVTCGATDCLTVLQVAGGYYNTCALMSDTTVRCWGNGLSGGNGYPRSEESYQPKAVPGLTNVKQITTAGSHTCALLMDGTARCWGSNDTGELGRGTTDTNENTVPMPVLNETGTAPLAGIQDISAGQFRTCAALLLPGGRREARCWGHNVKGSLGNGTAGAVGSFSALPQPVCLSGSVAGGNCNALGSVFQVSAGDEHACARQIGGAVACWGSNNRGQLGIPIDTVAHPNALLVKTTPGGSTNLLVDSVSASIGETGEATCAIRSSDKAVICWGTNASGQLGRGSIGNPLSGQETPAPVCGAATGCPAMTGSAIAVGHSHACTIRLDKVRCWGDGGSGQLGDGGTTDKPVSASDVATAANVKQLATGEYHTCAVLIDGRLQCWGWGEADGLIDPADPTGRQPNSLLPVFPTW